jgi:hypothetical protein
VFVLFNSLDFVWGIPTLNSPIKSPVCAYVRNLNNLETVAVMIRRQRLDHRVDVRSASASDGAAHSVAGPEEYGGCVCGDVAIEAGDEDPAREWIRHSVGWVCCDFFE